MSSGTVIALSGGVDSAVSALRLLHAGDDVSAIFMKNWEEDDTSQYCAAAEDLADAEQVCAHLGLDLRTVNFATEYWDRVFERFLAEYRAGRTPNPDIWCNREIKFKEFHDFAVENGAERIATGHYARVGRQDGRFQLLKGIDEDKDQSYFLYAIGQAELARTVFPLGEMTKHEVRSEAERAGLANHAKRGSTGICFIGERPFREFLAQYLPYRPGEMVTPDDVVVAEHVGLAFYTLGQRQGLGLGGSRDGDGRPWYVVDKDVEANRLIVAQGRDHPLLYRHALTACEVTWVDECERAEGFAAAAKTRYRQTDQPCWIEPAGGDRVRVRFDKPQWALTPGQSVVFYDADECLGGGIIDRLSDD